MKHLCFGIIASGVGFLTGCTHLDSTQKMQQAADLVRQKIGIAPDWQSDWDRTPPWSGSVLHRDEAVVIGLRNNRELRADWEAIGMADADLLQAGLLQNPVINLMLMFPDGGGRAMLRANSLPMMMLQDLWLVPARKKVAKAMLQQTILRAADRAIDTAAGVKRAYTRIQYTQRALELMRENLQIVEQSTRIIATRQAAGRSTQVQVNLSQIRCMKLRSELIAMEADHRTQKQDLLMLMGLADADDGWQVEALSEAKDPIEEPPGERELLAKAVEQRLDLLASHWEAEAAAKNVMLAHREGLPEVAVGFSLERAPAPRSNNQSLAGTAGNALAMRGANELVGMKPPVGAPAEPFMPKEREVKWTMGPMFQFTIPIFDHGQGKVARAMAEHRQKLAMYDGRVQEAVRSLREKSVMLRQAGAQVRYYRDEIAPSVERNLDVARRSFVSGMEDLTVYLEVQEDVLMTRLKMLEFYRDYLVNRVDLERQVGGHLEFSAPATQPASQPADALPVAPAPNQFAKHH